MQHRTVCCKKGARQKTLANILYEETKHSVLSLAVIELDIDPIKTLN